MNSLASLDRNALAATLERLGADGWLLFDFHGCNPVARQILPGGMGTRRLFVWIPRRGEITAIVHRIELQPFEGFAGKVVPFARHAELDAALRATLSGKTAAMEVSARDAVPYLDRIPWGVIDLLQSIGVTVVSSADLVTRFAATWSPEETAEHVEAAERLRKVALAALAAAVTRGGTGLTESAMQQEVVAAMQAAGLTLSTPPIVGFGPNAANPHYEPHPGADRTLARDEVVLLDLWAGMRPGAVFADQTWMGFSGRSVPEKVQRVWETVRNARDAAVRGAALPGPGPESRSTATWETRRRGKSLKRLDLGTSSCTGPVTASTAICTGQDLTSTTTRPTTTGRCCLEPAARWNRGSTCRVTSACGARSTLLGAGRDHGHAGETAGGARNGMKAENQKRPEPMGSGRFWSFFPLMPIPHPSNPRPPFVTFA